MAIDKRVWEQRLQDIGIDENTMKISKSKNYKRMQIPAFGPTNIYYVHLASIAIDFILSIKNDPQTWCRVPKNTTQVKIKIIELLLTERKLDDSGRYVLCQQHFLRNLTTRWSGSKAISNIVDNDKLRVFGLLMSHEVRLLQTQTLQ